VFFVEFVTKKRFKNATNSTNGRSLKLEPGHELEHASADFVREVSEATAEGHGWSGRENDTCTGASQGACTSFRLQTMLFQQNQKSLPSLQNLDFPVIHQVHRDSSRLTAPASVQKD
jgi:hypothetical protein